MQHIRRNYTKTTTSAGIALASWTLALTASGNAFAQSNVTLQGVIDSGVTYVNNQHGGAATLFDSGILTPTTLTLKGSEDLGEGNKALFELTTQFDSGSGATVPGAGQIFNRTALVGLANDRLGSLTFGNQYDFMFETLSLGQYDGALLFGGLYDFRQGPFAALGVPGNPTGSFDFDRMAGGTRVPNAVKYRSPEISGLTFGVLYGFGGVPGSFSADSTTSFGANYASGPLGLGAAYVEVKYPQLGNGHDGIRNFGFGAHYKFARVLAMLLYTNTKNTASAAKIDVYKGGVLWSISGPWALGLDYQYMKGNEVLQDNRAQQVATALQYNFSKRTTAYAEVVFQRASGDAAVTRAWINGLLQPDGAASNRSQTLARVGLQTKF
ncbi:porin [Caballeronia sordidicola]|uniref:Internalin n=1 Tax=Caballeronia sordidicola TaxID=196367 RepID=A0A226WW36_CABSO|nr:porin [Caballeronia sordidicola]OXC75333.1 Internalin [Caballeronia sordidicola]